MSSAKKSTRSAWLLLLGGLTLARKNTVVGNALDQPFRWSEALDAVAETYNGVCNLFSGDVMPANQYSVCFLVDVDISWPCCLVFVSLLRNASLPY